MSPSRAGGLLLALLAIASSASAVDTLGDLRKRHAIVWGGDQEGGGPYVYPREDDPSRVTGFEVEIAARIAEYLKVEPTLLPGSVGQDAGAAAHRQG